MEERKISEEAHSVSWKKKIYILYWEEWLPSSMKTTELSFVPYWLFRVSLMIMQMCVVYYYYYHLGFLFFCPNFIRCIGKKSKSRRKKKEASKNTLEGRKQVGKSFLWNWGKKKKKGVIRIMRNEIFNGISISHFNDIASQSRMIS